MFVTANKKESNIINKWNCVSTPSRNEQNVWQYTEKHINFRDKNVLNQDELHLIRILLDVKIAAKCANYKSRFFSLDTGAPQGDCANSSEFTFYPAKSL